MGVIYLQYRSFQFRSVFFQQWTASQPAPGLAEKQIFLWWTWNLTWISWVWATVQMSTSVIISFQNYCPDTQIHTGRRPTAPQDH